MRATSTLPTLLLVLLSGAPAAAQLRYMGALDVREQFNSDVYAGRASEPGVPEPERRWDFISELEPSLRLYYTGERSAAYLRYNFLLQVYALTEVSPKGRGQEAQAILARLARGPVSPDEDHWVVVGQDVLQMLAQAERGFWGVHTCAIDPGQPDRLYLGSVQGLWRSLTGGETWAPANLGGVPEARPVGAVYRIVVRPGEETELILWSDTGLHVRTLDTP